jgi:autoinducer 2 (AI-2) kinase
LWDIACSVKENLEILSSVTGSTNDFVWACGGGFQSKLLRQFIANLTGKKLLIREGYQQSSVVGGALTCNEALGIKAKQETKVEEVLPQSNKNDTKLYKEWKQVRNGFKQRVMEEMI